MRIDKNALGRPCPKCRAPISQKSIDIITKIKRENAMNMGKGIKHKVGRKKIRDDDQIYFLRKSGLTLRAIAKIIGLSTTAVLRSLKERASRND